MNTPRFLQFLDAMDAIVSRAHPEPALLDQSEYALKALIAHDDWLPPEFARPDAEKYQSYALYIDPQSRYSVISFVWGPGQGTPVHNHTVWGLVGVLRGAERCEEFPEPDAVDSPSMVTVHEHALLRGQVDRVSPTIGDWHRVSNALSDAPSISIHVYGADIGRVPRSFWNATTQNVMPMVSGYSNDQPWITAR
jgi:predicted metal-dependent enzyme (double-stranded beta helix superfamily)